MTRKEYWNQDWTKMPLMVALVYTSIGILISSIVYAVIFN